MDLLVKHTRGSALLQPFAKEEADHTEANQEPDDCVPDKPLFPHGLGYKLIGSGLAFFAEGEIVWVLKGFTRFVVGFPFIAAHSCMKKLGQGDHDAKLPFFWVFCPEFPVLVPQRA